MAAKGIDDLSWNEKGLIPAVIQDASTGEVLTLAYVSRESLSKTRELGETVFYSRRRAQLWHKGQTSGNSQKVRTLMADCDRDALVIRVQPQGPACHTGARSCFFEQVEGFEPDSSCGMGRILGELERLLEERKRQRPEGSYTARLFERGLPWILQKVGEEAVEVVIAGMKGNREEILEETADLLYHTLVALREMDISLEDVAAQLRARRQK